MIQTCFNTVIYCDGFYWDIFCNNGIFGGHNFLTVLFLHLAHVEDFLISTCERPKHLFLPTRSGIIIARRTNNHMWNVMECRWVCMYTCWDVALHLAWRWVTFSKHWKDLHVARFWQCFSSQFVETLRVQSANYILRRRRSYDLQNWFIIWWYEWSMNDHESWTCMQDLILNKITDACHRCDHWSCLFCLGTVPDSAWFSWILALRSWIIEDCMLKIVKEALTWHRGSSAFLRFWTPREVSIIQSFNF